MEKYLILMTFLIICLSLNILTVFGAEDFLKNRVYTRINNYRQRIRFGGCRDVYASEMLERMAEKKADMCSTDVTVENGYSLMLETRTEEEMKSDRGLTDSFIKAIDDMSKLNAVSRRDFKCISEDESKCLRVYRFYNPKAWRVGCAVAKCDKVSHFVCIFNRGPMQNPTSLPIGNICETCSGSFECRNEKTCSLIDSDNVPESIPEDDVEVPQRSSTHRAGGSGGDGSSTSRADGFISKNIGSEDPGNGASSVLGTSVVLIGSILFSRLLIL